MIEILIYMATLCGSAESCSVVHDTGNIYEMEVCRDVPESYTFKFRPSLEPMIIIKTKHIPIKECPKPEETKSALDYLNDGEL